MKEITSNDVLDMTLPKLQALYAALEPFAAQADSMWALDDKEKVCGVEVRHWRNAFKVCRG